MDETMSTTASSNSGNGIPNKGSNRGKKSTKKIRKLTPLEGNTVGQDFVTHPLLTESQLSSKGAQLISKVKAINNKRELIEAVRKVAPASVQLSPTLFHDISGNLKTVKISFFSPLSFDSFWIIDRLPSMMKMYDSNYQLLRMVSTMPLEDIMIFVSCAIVVQLN
jgi:hypothetical protein